MLSTAARKTIREAAERHWTHELDAFVTWATESTYGAKKDHGHAIAEPVDEVTSEGLRQLLGPEFEVLVQVDPKNKDSRIKRSMGDCWVRFKGVLHPINIKSGSADVAGQPNMVALARLTEALLRREIDSYYVLMVRIGLGKARSVSVAIFDLLDWLDFVSFDSGTGQVMLKQADFYRAYDSGFRPPAISIQSKVDRLVKMRVVGNQKTALKRAKDEARLQVEIGKYRLLPDYEIDQTGLHVG